MKKINKCNIQSIVAISFFLIGIVVWGKTTLDAFQLSPIINQESFLFGMFVGSIPFSIGTVIFRKQGMNFIHYRVTEFNKKLYDDGPWTINGLLDKCQNCGEYRVGIQATHILHALLLGSARAFSQGAIYFKIDEKLYNELQEKPVNMFLLTLADKFPNEKLFQDFHNPIVQPLNVNSFSVVSK